MCVHRCVQDPQQVVTRNRGGYAAARWLPIRQGLCVPLRVPPLVVGGVHRPREKRRFSSPLTPTVCETIIPRLPCPKATLDPRGSVSDDFSRLEQCSR